MALFEIAGDSEKDEGIPFLLGTDKNGNKIHVWVRRIPQHVSEAHEKKIPGKWKRKLQRRVRTPKEEFVLLQENLKWAITRIDGPLFAPNDDEAVKLFSEATGRKLAKGADVLLNDELNDETKTLLLRYVPVLHSKVLGWLSEINALEEEEEEATTENLSPGSSGSSPQPSPK